MENEETTEKILQLPIARIKKLIKVDPDVGLVQKDVLFLITKSAELFLQSLAKEAYEFTASDGKKTMLKRHVESAVNNIDALAFLDGMLD